MMLSEKLRGRLKHRYRVHDTTQLNWYWWQLIKKYADIDECVSTVEDEASTNHLVAQVHAVPNPSHEKAQALTFVVPYSGGLASDVNSGPLADVVSDGAAKCVATGTRECWVLRPFTSTPRFSPRSLASLIADSDASGKRCKWRSCLLGASNSQ